MFNNTTIIETDNRANPLLYSNIGLSIQPYWLCIIQAFTMLLIQRLYNRFWPWHNDEERTWLTSFEVFLLREFRDHSCWPWNDGRNLSGLTIFELRAVEAEYNRRRQQYLNALDRLKPVFRFNLLDLIFALIPIVQFILISVRQSKCFYEINGSLWKCYNLFGYDLYNYVYFGLQFIIFTARGKLNQYDDRTAFERLIQLFLSFCLVLFFICFIYMLTNIVPMMFVYHVIPFPIAIGITILYVLLIKILYSTNADNSFPWKCVRLSSFIAGWTLSTAILMLIYYNYSQYYYFGERYFQTIGVEYRSRDTLQWIKSMNRNSKQILHTILSFL